MSDVETEQDEDGRPLAEAAAWRTRLSEAGLPSSLEFEMWLRQPGAKAAWNQVNGAWAMFDDLAHEPAMIAARQSALGDAKRAGARLSVPRVICPLAAIAAILLIAVMAGIGSYTWLNRPDDYQTAAGERRVVTLADGSRLSLDANSEVTVQYRKHERALRLLKGQARFDVAHDKSRPFSVVAADRRVIATGTAFNIDMAGPKVWVTLIEGHVVVMDENSVGRSWELRAGQQLVSMPSLAPKIVAANTAKITAWTIGQIMFDDEPLSSVVDRVNRYSNTRIVIADPGVAQMRISGVFNAGDAPGFVEIVTHYLPVKAVAEGGGVIALQSEIRKSGKL